MTALTLKLLCSIIPLRELSRKASNVRSRALLCFSVQLKSFLTIDAALWAWTVARFAWWCALITGTFHFTSRYAQFIQGVFKITARANQSTQFGFWVEVEIVIADLANIRISACLTVVGTTWAFVLSRVGCVDEFTWWTAGHALVIFLVQQAFWTSPSSTLVSWFGDIALCTAGAVFATTGTLLASFWRCFYRVVAIRATFHTLVKVVEVELILARLAVILCGFASEALVLTRFALFVAVHELVSLSTI